MLNNLAQQESTDIGTSFFIGTVVDRADPSNKRRIKVSVPQLLEGGVTELPWLSPFLTTTITHGSNYGSYHLVPKIGDKVLAGFQQGSLLHGYYFGSALSKDSNVPAFNNIDVYGFTDPNGNTFSVNTSTGEVKFIHSSGMTFTISPSGNVNIVAPADVNLKGNLIVDGDITNTGSVNTSGNISSGALIAAVGDVTSGTFSFRNHTHGGVEPGNNSTSVPN
jgi:phage baseplate assembly protein gpV